MAIVVNCKGLYTPGGKETRNIAYLDVEYNGNVYDWLIYVPLDVDLAAYIEASKPSIQADIDKKELEWENLDPKTKIIENSLDPNDTQVVNIEKSEIVKPDYPDYYAKRRDEYPSIGDQLDALWKGAESSDFDRVMNAILEVKQKYPKV